MSDFSSLCPLFNTGVYSEIFLGNFTLASLASTTTKLAGIPFSRSVIITHAYVAKLTTPASTTANVNVKLYRAASFGAAATVFASLKLSKSTTAQPVNKYLAMAVTAKTFSATQWLILRCTKATSSGKGARVIVRYKEK